VIKERVALVKLTDTYDVLDPETGTPIGVVRDEPSTFAKWARLAVDKRLLPTQIRIYENEGAAPVLTLCKAPAIFRTTVVLRDASGAEIARFRSKFFSLGGGFFVFDPAGRQIGEVKGNWVGWEFRLLDSSGREIGVVSKKWAGIGKELFTSADTYVVDVHGTFEDRNARTPTTAVALAAGLAIDVVFKER
jgi:uncharacterized protein YxjI